LALGEHILGDGELINEIDADARLVATCIMGCVRGMAQRPSAVRKQ
jgi:hypothetical protein